MSRTWIKLYTEILGDVKVGTLTDRQFRLMITCFLLAGQKDEKGLVGTTQEIAWAMRHTTVKLANEGLAVLSKCEILSKKPNGWHLTNWEKRQRKPPSKQAAAEAARKRAARKKVRSGQIADEVRT